MTRFFSKAAAILGAAIFAIALASCDVPSEDGGSGWVGTYKTEDTQGNAMGITLNDAGIASGERAGKSLEGSWKADEGDSVVITWDDGWFTKLAKEGDGYKKSTWKGSMDGEPIHMTTAEKTK